MKEDYLFAAFDHPGGLYGGHPSGKKSTYE
jgi:hypothetical protein